MTHSEYPVQTWGAPVATLTFGAMRNYLRSAQRRGVGMMHTARPFSVYRKIFFNGRSGATVLDELQGKRVVDIGCGFTPFFSDSMFQACQRAGVDFYGVDPLLENAPAFGPREWLLTRATGARGHFNRRAPGLDRAIAASAQTLPFEDCSVDRILCSFLLFVWIEDETLLAEIFDEALRVLKPGGQLMLYPLPAWDARAISDRALYDSVARFDVSQHFVHGGLDPRIMPAMLTRFTRPLP